MTTFVASGSSPPILPTTDVAVRAQITCYDYLGNPKRHDDNQRYVSPTTGVCRKLVVQAVNPSSPNERRIKDHGSDMSKLALWLTETNFFSGPERFKWFIMWLWFIFLLLGFSILMAVYESSSSGYLNSDDYDDSEEDSTLYRTGNYKPYMRSFRRQFWVARSPKEYSSRTKSENVPIHSLHPRLLMIRDSTSDCWSLCKDPVTIIHTKFIAISYCAADMDLRGADGPRHEEDFIQEVRSAVAQQKFDAYWLDLECLGNNPEERKLDLYCMADVYRRADITLIMLGESLEDAWKHWGGRVWTLPEALLSRGLCYKFRRRNEVHPISLHQLGNLAYEEYDSEQAIIHAYSGKDPLERLERLTLLKSAIWRRGIASPSPQPIPSMIPSPGRHPLAADRVYALMGFFGHRIQPDYLEENIRALARLSMANDNDRIVERMVSLLPSTISNMARWYADDDIYAANLWDVVPEIQVAGITENGALVLDGCKVACVRWKDFPKIAYDQADSERRTLALVFCYLAWPCIVVGGAVWMRTRKGGIALAAIGCAVLLFSPRLFMFSQCGRVVNAQPWLIGVKGVLDLTTAAVHLYGGGIKGRHRRLAYTPSGSDFSVPEEGPSRDGARAQYDLALAAEQQGPRAGKMYTLIDTHSSTMYYFSAEKPPTVCLFTGREGGLGRFVLCSERCAEEELHKETVLRMPTHISQRMELCDWVALG